MFGCGEIVIFRQRMMIIPPPLPLKKLQICSPIQQGRGKIAFSHIIGVIAHTPAQSQACQWFANLNLSIMVAIKEQEELSHIIPLGIAKISFRFIVSL